MKDNTILKQTKFFISIVKEKIWLEQMALEGWSLIDMTMGIKFTFEKRMPQKLIYEIDRFSLPNNPTLIEIRRKEEFLDMAKEMGWKVVVHDEDQNYYFCKEFQDGEINELYNDIDSRQLRAEKYYKRFMAAEVQMTKLSLLVSIIGFILAITTIISSNTSTVAGFVAFIFGYLCFCLGVGVIYRKIANTYYKELLMTTDEFKEYVIKQSKDSKTIYKLIFTNKKLKKFLLKQSKEGWHLVNTTALKYIFTRGESVDYIYTMDSKYLTNQRTKSKGIQLYKDNKDWFGMNNDWQLQSLKDAETKNWNFVCALENRAILYRSSQNEQPELLNEIKYEKRFRFTSLTGQAGIWVLVGALLGAVIGAGAAWIGL